MFRDAGIESIKSMLLIVYYYQESEILLPYNGNIDTTNLRDVMCLRDSIYQITKQVRFVGAVLYLPQYHCHFFHPHVIIAKFVTPCHTPSLFHFY